MFLLLGMRSAASVLLITTFACGVCGTRATQRVLKLQRRITVFFVPLIPIGTSWAVECDHCGTATALSREQAEHSLRWAAANDRAVA